MLAIWNCFMMKSIKTLEYIIVYTKIFLQNNRLKILTSEIVLTLLSIFINISYWPIVASLMEGFNSFFVISLFFWKLQLAPVSVDVAISSDENTIFINALMYVLIPLVLSILPIFSLSTFLSPKSNVFSSRIGSLFYYEIITIIITKRNFCFYIMYIRLYIIY